MSGVATGSRLVPLVGQVVCELKTCVVEAYEARVIVEGFVGELVLKQQAHVCVHSLRRLTDGPSEGCNRKAQRITFVRLPVLFGHCPQERSGYFSRFWCPHVASLRLVCWAKRRCRYLHPRGIFLRRRALSRPARTREDRRSLSSRPQLAAIWLWIARTSFVRVFQVCGL